MFKLLRQVFKLHCNGQVTYRLPPKTNIVIYDALTAKFLLEILKLPNDVFIMHVRKELIYLHPKIVLKILFKIFSSKEEIRIIYEATLIKVLSPRLVLTYLDNDGAFGRLAHIINARFIAVQNGFRTSQCFSRISHMPELYLFGRRCMENYIRRGFSKERLVDAGSLKVAHVYEANGNNFFRDKKFDVILISSYQLGMELGDCEDKESIRKHLCSGTHTISEYLSHFLLQHTLKVGILLWATDEVGSREYRYFYNIFKDDVTYIRKETEVASSYFRVLESEVVLSYGSTLGFEAISMGKKVMFFPSPEEEVYCLEHTCHPFFITRSGSYEEFEENLNNLLNMSDYDYIEKIGELSDFVVSKKFNLVCELNNMIKNYS